jgi:hypothetical protein
MTLKGPVYTRPVSPGRRGFLLAALGLAVIGGGLGAGLSLGGSQSPVPGSVQSLVRKAHPGLAYLPTRLPAGYRYSKYDSFRTGFGFFFSKAGEAPNQLGYGTGLSACATEGSPMHTFTMDGVQVRWSATYEDQQAWRCLITPKGRLVIDAYRSIAGDDGLKTPKQLHDALDLVRMVAYSRRIG